jgi:hypothetical protein
LAGTSRLFYKRCLLSFLNSAHPIERPSGWLSENCARLRSKLE